MRYGIPGFRTPREVLDAEIQRIVDLGIDGALKCRIGTDVTLDVAARGIRRGVPRHGRAVGAATACAGRRCAERRHRDGVPEGVQRRAAAPCRQARRRHRRRRHVDRRRDGRAPPRPHRAREAHRLSRARDRRAPRARRGVGVGQAGRRGDADVGVQRRQDAGQQARDRAGAGRGHRDPRRAGAGLRGQGRERPRHRAAGRACEAKFVGPRLEIKVVEGTEEDIPGRPHRLGDRPGGRLHRAGGLRQRPRRGQRRQELPGRGQARHLRRRRRAAAAPAHHRDRPRCDRRRRHRPVPARRGAGQAAEDRRPRVRPAAQDDREGPHASGGARADPRHRQRATSASTTTTTAPTAT